MELNISEGKISLIKIGSMLAVLASFFEIFRPKIIDKEIKKPYHLILINPRFNNCDPGDFKKAG
tara:strand:+ start:967 stop:1158 length:192 start_codon:yes stop_codon:yes gene_type:complete